MPIVYALRGSKAKRKDGNSVLFQLEKSKKSCGGHIDALCTLATDPFVIGVRVEDKFFSEIFSSMIL